VIDKLGSELKDYAPLIVRLGLSVIFILQGALGVRGLRSAGTAEIVTTCVELLGGLFLLIGFMTRWAGFALACLTIWVIAKGPQLDAFTDPSDQIYLACAVLSLVAWMLGGGRMSLDEKAKKKE
jgi:uncharacterized membrane protein YphA (DoxX/SURF4 family)